MWIIPCCVLKLDDCLHVILLCLLQVSKSPCVGLSWRYEIILANNSLALQGGKNLVRCSQCFTESWWYRILFETCAFSLNIFHGYDWGCRINRCKNHPPFDFTHFFTIMLTNKPSENLKSMISNHYHFLVSKYTFATIARVMCLFNQLNLSKPYASTWFDLCDISSFICWNWFL